MIFSYLRFLAILGMIMDLSVSGQAQTVEQSKGTFKGNFRQTISDINTPQFIIAIPDYVI